MAPMRRGGLAVIFFAGVALCCRTAAGQAANSGALTGIVTDASTGKPLAGVTVVAQGPQAEQAELTDDSGSYTITGLLPGMYVVRMFYGDIKVERQNVQVFADKKIQVNVAVQTRASHAETYTITEKAPTVDVGSTQIGTTISKEFAANVPVGRNFESVATVAPGALNDDLGVSFGGATSFENNYVIDGINVTSIHMSNAADSALGSGLNLDFVQEVEVITGGYNAEYGRSTGGVVNVITKSGSNEFHGDAAMYYDPGSLRGRSPRLSFPGSSIATEPDNALGDYRLDFFADLGGPLIKDRVWFYVGIEPVFTHSTTRRIVSALVDNCTQSDPLQAGPCTGSPDGIQDYVGGQYQTRELYRTTRDSSSQELQWTAKVNFLVTPDHTLELAYYGSPSSNQFPRIIGSQFNYRYLGGSQDAIAHWVSKLFDRKWQLEASLSYHRERNIHEPDDPLDGQLRTAWETDPVASTNVADRQGAGPSLSWFTQYEDLRYADLIRQNCDTIATPFGADPGSIHPTRPQDSKLNIVCPVFGYTVGGRGSWENLIADRIGTRIAGTNFVRAWGHHQFMYGWDFERNGFDDVRLFTDGGALRVRQIGSSKRVYQRGWGYFLDQGKGLDSTSWANLAKYPIKRDANYEPVLDGMGNPVADYSQCTMADDIPQGASFFCAQTSTMNHALFARDSWSLLPNLTLNLGVRWERQAVTGLSDWEAPITGDSPILLNKNFAPRFGVIYDPTNEGKAKIYGSFARFYESIPLDINNRSFAQEGYMNPSYYFSNFNKGSGTALGPNPACKETLLASNRFDCQFRLSSLHGGEQALIEPEIQGMYTDEIVIGGEYEIIEDLALGAYFTHRTLGPVIEDGSVDGGNTYFITNPGESVSSGQLQTLRDRAVNARQLAAQNMSTGHMTLASDYAYLASELETFADQLPYFGNFAKPTRDYNAFTVTARKRFSRNWLAQASYTYARTIGNYPGLYDPYIGQQDPNISELYDLPDVLLNRNGPLPSDVPHQIKLDGYYTFQVGSNDAVVFGTSLRAHSGIPRNVFGYNQTYYTPIVFLIPSSEVDRNDFVTTWDVQIAYTHRLPHATQMQLFFAAYNVLDSSTVTARDDTYTASSDFTTPVANGKPTDLWHLKTVDGQVAKPNAAYGSPIAYQSPLATRFGLRLSF